MDADKTDELRAAHDVLADFYAARLTDSVNHMPVERAVLDLFCELTRAADLGDQVGDIGCGIGHLEPYLAARGMSPRGVDLSRNRSVSLDVTSPTSSSRLRICVRCLSRMSRWPVWSVGTP